MFSVVRSRVPALLAVLALSSAGCSPPRAAAAPDASPAPDASAASTAPVPAAPAQAIPTPKPSALAMALPDLAGMDARDAHTLLRELGVQIQAIAFDESLIVTAQYPEPGALVAPGDAVTAWLGTPPAPPPPAQPDPSEATDAVKAELAAVEASASAPTAADSAPAADTAKPPPPAASAAPDGPTPPRTSPRRQPPAEVGTVLTGLASWYGPGFEGKGTACGQKFDPSALTMASRELRCGTRVLVTGPSGASVEAVVNDWGPAEWTNRRFDLSRATFEAIHPLGAGVVSVTVEVLAP